MISREADQHPDPALQDRRPGSRRVAAFLFQVALPILLAVFLVLYGWLAWSAVRDDRRAEPQLSQLRSTGQGDGAEGVTARGLPDGGVRLGGRLEGRDFALMVPRTWNREVVLFVHGYTLPDSPVKAPKDLSDTELSGTLKALYGQGFAIGFAAYDKAGYAVQSGAENTLRLRKYLTRFHPDRVYAVGMSMGGTITMALLEQMPGNFDGALAVCGVVDGWQPEMRFLIDLRAAYEYFTRNTPYALPGEQGIERSLLPTKSQGVLRIVPALYRLNLFRRVMNPVADLFKAARKTPGGVEDKIVKNIASTAHVDEEVATYLFPLVTIGLGMDDMQASMGGVPYGNEGKTYHSDFLSDEENARMNREIQRIRVSPGAVGYTDTWHRSQGVFQVPLVTLHNRVDPLVPYAQETALGATVEARNNAQHLFQMTVPASSSPLIGTGLTGLSHCGFKKEQVLEAFGQMHTWVITGIQPGKKE